MFLPSSLARPAETQARCLQRLSLDSFYKAAIPEQLAAQQERDAKRSGTVVHLYMIRQKKAVRLAVMHRVHTLQPRNKSSNGEEVESAAVAVSDDSAAEGSREEEGDYEGSSR